MRASKKLVDLLADSYGGMMSGQMDQNSKQIRVELEAMGVEFDNQADLYPEMRDIASVLESLERMAGDEGIIDFRYTGTDREVPDGAIAIHFWEATFQRGTGLRKTIANAGTLLEAMRDLRDLLRNWTDLRARELRKEVGIG